MNRSSSPLAVAVVGSGIAGLAAAWLLHGRHTVTLYEQAATAGGHCNTVELPGPDGSRLAVDTGFIVYNTTNYPNLVALFDHLGVTTHASDMSFAVSLAGGALEYSGTDLKGLLAQPSNLLRPRFWSMLRDIGRFCRTAPRLLAREHDGLTLGRYLDAEGYGEPFIYDHLLPMGAAIWSTTVTDMLAYPAAAFVRFFESHGLLRLADRPRWRTVTGGSQRYVEKITEALAGHVRLACPVNAIRRQGDGVLVEERSGRIARFDHVVLATHADQSLALLADASADERRLLGSFSYARNRTVLHSDPALMPRRRRAWASWNFIADARGGSEPPCVTYWMNSLQGLDPRRDLFVTINPIREPRHIHAAFEYDHPGFDNAALAAQRQLWSLQGTRGTWFCGAYFGAGFHEDGLQSGLAVAEALGGVRRPWSVENESGRIVLAPAGARAEQAA